ADARPDQFGAIPVVRHVHRHAYRSPAPFADLRGHRLQLIRAPGPQRHGHAGFGAGDRRRGPDAARSARDRDGTTPQIDAGHDEVTPRRAAAAARPAYFRSSPLMARSPASPT